MRLAVFWMDFGAELRESTIVKGVAAEMLAFSARGTLISGFRLGWQDVEFGKSDGGMVLDLGEVERLCFRS